MERFHYIVLRTIFTTVLLFFGTISIIRDILFSYAPLAVILMLCLVGSTYYLRIPPPSKDDVITVLGADPGLTMDNQEELPIYTTGAHRGAGLDAPENSLVAFKVCAEKGINLVEFDVSLTADNVPVVFHDNSLERLTDHGVLIETLNFEELSQFDISIKHPHRERFKNTHIPKLEVLVKQLLSNRQKMFIDLKGSNKKMVNVIVKLFSDYQELHKYAVVTSFFPHLIYMIRRKDPRIVCSLAWRPYCMSAQSYNFPDGIGCKRTDVFYKHFVNVLLDVLYEWSLSRIIYYVCGISVILLHKDVISGKTILDWRSKGVRVIAWTVNHPLEKQHFSRVLKITYLTDTLIGEATAHLTHHTNQVP